MMRFLAIVKPILLCGLIGITASAVELPLPVADLKRTEPVDFAKEIMPILKRNCLACHHQKEAEGGLVLETIDSISKGGDSGPGVVANEIDASLLFTRARGTEEPLMPPEDNEVGAKPLTPDELGLLSLWIQQGAAASSDSMSESIDWQPIPESIRTSLAMDVSPDGQYAAIGRGNRILIVDLATHAEVDRLVDSSLAMGEVADVDLIQSIAFSPDAQRIASGGFRTVRIWKKAAPYVDPSSTPLSGASGLVAVKSDETAVALVNAIGDIEIWDLVGNQRLHTLSGHRDRITGLTWAGNQDRIYSSDATERLTAWQPSTGSKIAEFDAKSVLTQLAATHDAIHVAAIDTDRKTQLFRIAEDGKSIERVVEAVGGVSDAAAVAFTNKPAALVMIASESSGVMMVGLSDNKVVRKIDHGAVVDSIAVTNDQTRLVTGGRDGKTRIWNIADGKPITSLEGSPRTQLHVARAKRDALREKAAADRLNKKTDELEKRLTKETEALTKVTEEHKKATESLAAEEKKRVDGVALVKATEALIAKAAADAAAATDTTETAKKKLADAKSVAQSSVEEIESQAVELKTAQQKAAKAQQEVAAITKQLNEAMARAAQIEKVIETKNAAVVKANDEAAKAQVEIDAAKKLAEAAKAATEKATKELDAQKKAVETAEAAKKKSELEVTKRGQALETSTGAQERAAAAVPAHKTILESQTRRRRSYDAQLARAQGVLNQPGNEVISIAVSLDDKLIATAHKDGSVRVYRIDEALPISSFQSPRLGPSEVSFVGDLVCNFGISQAATLWSTGVDWTLERTIGAIDDATTISDRVTAIDFRRDGMSIAVGSGPPSRSGEVKIFAVESGQLVRDFGPVHSDTVLGLEFSPDGLQVASSAADKTIRLLSVTSGTVTRSLEGHTHHVLSIAWQDDGQTMASASADQSVKIWNTETGEQRKTISGFSKEITAVDFVRASNQIVTACADGQLRLYDASSGKSIRTFNAAGDFLFSLSVTPDGKKLLASGQSGVVRIWTLADGKLVHELQ